MFELIKVHSLGFGCLVLIVFQIMDNSVSLKMAADWLKLSDGKKLSFVAELFSKRIKMIPTEAVISNTIATSDFEQFNF